VGCRRSGFTAPNSVGSWYNIIDLETNQEGWIHLSTIAINQPKAETADNLSSVPGRVRWTPRVFQRNKT